MFIGKTLLAVLLARLSSGSDSLTDTNQYSQYPNMLAAGVTDEGDFVPFELWAGEAKIVTSQGTADATALEQFRVVAHSATGTLIPWDGVTFSGQGKAIGFTAQPIPAGVTGPIFIGGAPNHAALIWPVAVNTIPLRKMAFDGTPIDISVILGVGTQITYP
jgi:hypothetical protein